MSNLEEFYKLRIEALEKELKRTSETLKQISEIPTRKALDIKVIISDENFDKPLSNLEKKYGN